MDHLLGDHDPALWIGFLVGVVVCLVLDLVLVHRRPHAPTLREALLESAGWIALALGFAAFVFARYGRALGTEFLTAYVMEKSLSVDNLFVILLVMRELAVPPENRHRVLFWGVFGAIVLRAVLIVGGVQLVHAFDWLLYVFGAFLIVAAVKLVRGGEDDAPDPARHWAARLLRRVMPVTPRFHGDRFLAREEGVLVATPMLVAVVLVEASDLVFAVDSIPAVLGVTRDPFVAFSSNVLAVLGLRALFFVLEAGVRALRYLTPALAIVLAFVGAKMLLVDVVHIGSTTSLAVVLGVLAVAAVASVRGRGGDATDDTE